MKYCKNLYSIFYHDHCIDVEQIILKTEGEKSGFRDPRKIVKGKKVLVVKFVTKEDNRTGINTLYIGRMLSQN